MEAIIRQLCFKFGDLSEHFSFGIEDLAEACEYDIAKDSLKIAKSLESQLLEYCKNLDSKLTALPQSFCDERQKYYQYELFCKHNKNLSQSDIDEIVGVVRSYNTNLEGVDSNKSYQSNLSKWKDLIDKKEKEFQIQTLQDSQNELIERVKEWIELMKQFQMICGKMGDFGDMFSSMIMANLRAGLESGKKVSEYIDEKELLEDADDECFGSGVGNESGKLQKKMFNLEKWLNLLEKDSVKKLCDMLGRLAEEKKRSEMESYMQSQTYGIRTQTPYVKEEISGVTLGRDLENVLPQELSLLDDPDFSILFDLKFSENRLFCFQKQGYEEEQREKNVAKEREKEAPADKGPIILCVDTSGSMSGEPETIAKAITLYFAKRAMEQKRACYLINFSVGIETLDLTPPNGLFELMSFLEMSFNGGTDSLPALKEGLKKMKDEEYKRADLLFVSDFIFSGNDEHEIKELMNEKDKENKCYALYVGDFGRSTIKRKVFDDEFIYNTSKHSVDSLNRFTQSIGI